MYALVDGGLQHLDIVGMDTDQTPAMRSRLADRIEPIKPEKRVGPSHEVGIEVHLPRSDASDDLGRMQSPPFIGQDTFMHLALGDIHEVGENVMPATFLVVHDDCAQLAVDVPATRRDVTAFLAA